MPNLRLKNIRERITDRKRAPRSWWYPKPDQDPHHPDALKELHTSYAKAINKTMFALLGVGLYCLLKVFGESDKSLIVPNTTIQTPLVGTSISFQSFLLVAPFLLVILVAYLHILYGYWLPLEKERREMNKKIVAENSKITGADKPEPTIESIPAIFSFTRRMPRFFTNLIFYWFVPLTLWIMARKSFALKEFILPFSYIVSVVTLSLLFLQINRCPESKKRWLWNLPQWIALGMLVAFMFKVSSFSDSLRRPLDLQREDLHGAWLQGLDMAGADMNNANLQEANLVRANLQGVNLQNANLQKALLSVANFQKAHLDGANLQQADLRNANLKGAKLGNAKLQGATLAGTDFEEADLPLANLQGALFSEETNFSSADLSFANFREAKELDHSGIRYATNWDWAFYSNKQLLILKLPTTHNQEVEKDRLENNYGQEPQEYSDFNDVTSARPFELWKTVKSYLVKVTDGYHHPKLKIGDEYGGGKVAYLLQPGDKGYVEGEQHGLIAAKEDIKTTYIDAWNKNSVTGYYRWSTGQYENESKSDYAYKELLNTSTRIGEGAANTENILEKYPSATFPNSAAAVARAYRGGGKDDWFLPSKSELNQLYINRSAVGGFADGYYWSSTEISADDAWIQGFGSGGQDYNGSKNDEWRVRPVRAF